VATQSLSLKGGDKLNAYLAKLADKIGGGGVVRVEFLEGSTYPPGKKVKVKKKGKVVGRRITTATRGKAGRFKAGEVPEGETGTPLAVAQVAFWNEFGTKTAPPRPFFRNAIADKSDEWGNTLAALVKPANFDIPAVLGIMGEVMQGDIRESIIALVSPKLSDRTVEEKGFDKPLIDTSTMLRAVDYEVDKVPAR